MEAIENFSVIRTILGSIALFISEERAWSNAPGTLWKIGVVVIVRVLASAAPTYVGFATNDYPVHFSETGILAVIGMGPLLLAIRYPLVARYTS